MTRAVRGAIQVRRNRAKLIEEAAGRLAQVLLEANRLGPADLVSLQFSVTRDLTAANPATGARKALPALAAVPLFCVQEARVRRAVPRVVRLLATFEVPAGWAAAGIARATPVYLDGAERLRPDLGGQSGP